MTKSRIYAQFNEHGVASRRQSDSPTLAPGNLVNGPHTLNIVSSKGTSVLRSLEVCLSSSLFSWHERLAHASTAAIQSVMKRGVVRGATMVDQVASSACVGCILEKSHGIPIQKTR